ncbi:MAG: hypothetical protein AB7F31_07765 [Parachlamydiales bacterium]
MAEQKKRPDLKDAFQEVLKVLRQPVAEVDLQNLPLEEVVERLEESLETLNEEMDKIYKNTGMSRQQIEEYASNPDNFSKEEWKLLNEVREELDLFRQEAESVLGPVPAEVGAGPVVERAAPKKGGPKKKKGWKRA